MVEVKVGEKFLFFIKKELVIMEECWRQPRSKGVCRNVYVGRQSTGAINRG